MLGLRFSGGVGGDGRAKWVLVCVELVVADRAVERERSQLSRQRPRFALLAQPPHQFNELLLPPPPHEHERDYLRRVFGKLFILLQLSKLQ